MNKKIIKKIMKCLSLANSANANEAAIALRHAQKLMQEHGITDADIMIAEVSEHAVTTGRTSLPPLWLISLTNLVSKAFGVEHILIEKYGTNKYVFIGVGPAAEVAGYTFTVLRRQLTKERKDYIKQRCGRRGKQSTRTRKGDLFAQAYVRAITNKVKTFAMPVKTKEAINHYLAVNHSNLTTFEKKSVNHKKNDIDALVAGSVAGRDVTLHHGVDGSEIRSGLINIQITKRETHV